MQRINSFLLEYKYIPSQYENNVRTFKYAGVDKSLLYKYILSPIADYCLRFTPLTMAPNTLTIISFLMTLFPHLIYLYIYGQEFEGEIPQWLMIMTLFLYICYMNVDNMDGKQARRTGNTSSLGMLFDHQIDSMVCILMGVNVVTTLQFGTTYTGYLTYAFAAQQFLFNTLEAYYTGMMDLPIINAASEGVLAVGGFFFLSIMNGPSWWSQPVSFFFDIPIREFTLFLCLVLTVITSIPVIRNIRIKNKDNFQRALMVCLFGLFIIYTGAFLIAFSSVSKTHARQIYYLCGFSFSTQCGIIQSYHVADVPLPIIRLPGLILLGAPILNTIYQNMTGFSIINEGFLINFTSISAILSIKRFNSIYKYIFSVNSLFRKYQQTNEYYS